ncbi:MAG: hypothetical protein HYU36_17280 [Planctomycetes bacterium]|nr:hypothetical protein [Planctomycetota bacterium]
MKLPSRVEESRVSTLQQPAHDTPPRPAPSWTFPKAFDLERHNEDVRRVWEAYHQRRPIRVPVIFGINARYTLLGHPHVHEQTQEMPKGLGEIRSFEAENAFEQYWSSPDEMLLRQLVHQDWIRHHILQDVEMGVPSNGWTVSVDLQNVYEAAWFGCEVHHRSGQVPDTLPLLADDRKNLLFDRGTPYPFRGGIMAKNWDYYEHFKKRQAEGLTFRGKPIAQVNPSGLGTDGPLTVACNLRGATAFMTDLLWDPEYAYRLLEYVTEATIFRIQAFRRHLGVPLKTPSWGFADDSIQLISDRIYRDMIFPFHKKLVSTFSEGGPNSIHLCGDATRHFPLLREELNIQSFDTGFPVDFCQLRQQMGLDVEIKGGPSVPFLSSATPDEVWNETRRILQSGIKEGGRFILREGNNLAPDIPLPALSALYQAGKEYGTY